MGDNFPVERLLVFHSVQHDDAVRFFPGQEEVPLADPPVKRQGFFLKAVFLHGLIFHSLPGPPEPFLDRKIEEKRQVRFQTL